jgi:hypothetical protein
MQTLSRHPTYRAAQARLSAELGGEPTTLVNDAPTYRAADGQVLGLVLGDDWQVVSYTAAEAEELHRAHLLARAAEHDARAASHEERARLAPRYAAANLDAAARERRLADEFRARAAAIHTALEEVA